MRWTLLFIIVFALSMIVLGVKAIDTNPNVQAHYTYDNETYDGAGALVFDNSSYANHGIETNTLYDKSPFIFVNGSGYSSAEDNDGVDVPDDLIPSAGGDFTFCTFIRTGSISDTQRILSNNDGSDGRMSFGIVSSVLNIFIGRSSPSNLGLAGATTLISNDDYHICITKNGNNHSLWLNGSVDATQDYTGTIDNTLDLFIGRLPSGTSQGFQGFMDESWFFNISLTESEIEELRVNNTYTSEEATPESNNDVTKNLTINLSTEFSNSDLTYELDSKFNESDDLYVSGSWGVEFGNNSVNANFNNTWLKGNNSGFLCDAGDWCYHYDPTHDSVRWNWTKQVGVISNNGYDNNVIRNLKASNYNITGILLWGNYLNGTNGYSINSFDIYNTTLYLMNVGIFVARNVYNSTFDNLTVYSNDNSGIYYDYTDGITNNILNNSNFYSNVDGIVIDAMSGVTVHNTISRDNSAYGIELYRAHTHSSEGPEIVRYSPANNNILDNVTVYGNNIGVGIATRVRGYDLSDTLNTTNSQYNTIRNSKIYNNDKYGVSILDANNQIINTEIYGHSGVGDANVYINDNISNNVTASNITISGSTIYGGNYDILALGNSTVTIVDNFFGLNNSVGEDAILMMGNLTVNPNNQEQFNITLNEDSNNYINFTVAGTTGTINFNVSVNPNNNYTLYIDGVEDVTYDPSTTVLSFSFSDWSEHELVLNETVGPIELTPPTFNTINEYPLDSTTYVINQLYNFNVTVTDASVVDTVLLEWAGVNYSTTKTGDVYNVSFSNLTGGVYNYKYWANDTLGNTGYSVQQNYTITVPPNGLLLVVADEFIYKKSRNNNIIVFCQDNETYASCSANADCDITIIQPDSTILNNQQMENNLNYHNYSFKTEQVGNYYSTIVCNDTGIYNSIAFPFKITYNGLAQNDWTFILGISVLIFLLLFTAIKLDTNHIVLQTGMVFFSFIFAYLIPSFYLTSTTPTIFYRSFMFFVSLFAIYVIVYGIHWVLIKFQLIVPKGGLPK